MLIGTPAITVPRLAPPRWGRVAVLIVALIALGQLALAAGEEAPRLGLRVAADAGGAVVSWVQPAGTAWDAGIRPGDRPIAPDGRPLPVAEAGAAAGGASIRVRRADGAILAASTRAVDATAARRQGAFLLLAAWCALVGGATFIAARETAAALALLVSLAGAAAALLAALATPYGPPWSLATVYVGLTCFGGGLPLFFLRFPLDRAGTPLGRGCLALGAAAHAALLAAYPVVAIAAPAAYDWLSPVRGCILLADFGGACLLAAAAWWTLPQSRAAARAALAPAALGLAAGVLPFALLTLLPPLLGVPRPVAPDLAALTVGFLPAGLALALLSRQFLGATRLLRRGLIAAVVWLGLLGLCAVALDGVRQALGRQGTPFAAVLGSTLTTGALFAGAFPPVQAGLRRALERRLFPDLYDPAALIQEFGAALAGLPGGDAGALAQEILSRLAHALDLAWCLVALADDRGQVHTWTHGPTPAGLAMHHLCNGTPSAHATGEVALVAPLIVDGARRGALALGPKRHDVELLPGDARLVATLAPVIAIALQNALRADELDRQVAALAAREATLTALGARLLTAQEEERRRLALELHDDPLQRVTLLARRADPGTRLALEEIGGALRAICTGLRPPVLDDLGLPAALDWLAENARAQSERDLLIEVRAAPESAWWPRDSALEAALFRVAQEALHNILKHAEADAVAIELAADEAGLRLVVADDGRGFDATPATTGGGAGAQLGLVGMRERLRPWGGDVRVTARAGGGTIVEATVPRRRRDG